MAEASKLAATITEAGRYYDAERAAREQTERVDQVNGSKIDALRAGQADAVRAIEADARRVLLERVAVVNGEYEEQILALKNESAGVHADLEKARGAKVVYRKKSMEALGVDVFTLLGE